MERLSNAYLMNGYIETTKTLANCNFSLKEICTAIKDKLVNDGTWSDGYRNQFDRCYEGKRYELSIVVDYLNRASLRYDFEFPVKTKYGDIVAIHHGVSKYCLVIYNADKDGYMVLKVSKTDVDTNTGRYVPSGWDQLQNEVDAWRKYRNTADAIYLAPIYKVYTSSYAMIEAYAAPLDSVPYDEDEINTVKSALHRMGIDDLHPDNLGIHLGRIVALDYGYYR